MDAQLLIWLVERYTRPGETILDPMAGSGTTMLACTIGRNVILVELEKPFVDMMIQNWERVRSIPALFHDMGHCTIVQGDARQLEGITDAILTSPPYAESATGRNRDEFWQRLSQDSSSARAGRQSHPRTAEGYSEDPNNIGNLPYGDVDSIVTSPPYGAATSGGGIAQEGYTKDYQPDKIGGGNTDPIGKRTRMPETIGEDEENIQRLPYGDIDAVITSPPYEGIEARDRSRESSFERERTGKYPGRGDLNISKGYTPVDNIVTSPPYEESLGQRHHAPSTRRLLEEKRNWNTYTDRGSETNNIGNMRKLSYLEAMREVYGECFRVLKPRGTMVLVTKNFIRDKTIVPLDEHTVALCQGAGFVFLESHRRKLTGESFWRRIYRQKYPDAPSIDHEDVLVFRKG